MKNIRFESLRPLPPVGSSWMAARDVLMARWGKIHQYDDAEIMFEKGTICTVLESWHHSRETSLATIIIPRSLLKFTIDFDDKWEYYGWERI